MDYYCFPTKTGDISVFLNLKQYTDFKERFFYQITQEDVMLAKEKGKLLLFDLRTQTFIDCNGKTVDIKGKEVFPRCKIQESEQLLNAIEKIVLLMFYFLFSIFLLFVLIHLSLIPLAIHHLLE